MNAPRLSKLQKSLMSCNTGENYTVKGIKIQTKFMVNVNRGRDRYLLFINGGNCGFVDYVTPYNIFKSSYEVYHLDFFTHNKFNFPGLTWEANPYPDENQPAIFFPTFRDVEKMIDFLTDKGKDFLTTLKKPRPLNKK